jgi:hypothetical protein
MRGPRSTDSDVVDEYVAAGGRWCAQHRRWFQVRGNGSMAGACKACKAQVAAEREGGVWHGRRDPVVPADQGT